MRYTQLVSALWETCDKCKRGIEPDSLIFECDKKYLCEGCGKARGFKERIYEEKNGKMVEL